MDGLSTPAWVAPSDCLIVQTVSPDYRQVVWDAVSEALDVPVVVIAGTSHFAPSAVTRHTSQVPLIRVTNCYLLGRRLLVQRLPLGTVIAAEAVVCELNPRILTTWALLIARRLKGRRTLLWGHAFSHTVQKGRAGLLRWLFCQFADGIILYSLAELAATSARMPKVPTFVAPNSLMREHEMIPRTTLTTPWRFLFVGRLAPEKKPELLLKAFSVALPGLAPSTHLTFVGDGPLTGKLRQLANDLGLADRVDFWGHVSDIRALRALYDGTLATVSPGYAGLSLTQSLGFGVPMIIADREPHAPEIEAAVPGFNCEFFAASDVSSLAKALCKFESRAEDWIARAEAISAACRSSYSVDAMAEHLADALRSGRRTAVS